jgi:hypothetical protein
MREPERWEGINWSIYLAIAKNRLGIGVQEFWKMTFAEWWPLYNVGTKGMIKPLDSRDLRKLNERYVSGKFRRTSS